MLRLECLLVTLLEGLHRRRGRAVREAAQEVVSGQCVPVLAVCGPQNDVVFGVLPLGDELDRAGA